MAAANKPTQGVYEFGRFRLDAAQRLLWRDGEVVLMPPRVFDTLLVLVEHSGHLLEKDDLMRRLWPDTIVEEVTLARNISDLRKILGETEGGQKYIETVPRRGYQFVAPVRKPGANVVDLVVEKRARVRIVAEEGEAAALPQPPLWESDEGPRPGRRRAIWLVASVALVAVTAALLYLWTARTKEAGLVKPIRSIAVLPFKPLTADNRDESLEIGLADTLITRLNGLKHLTVRPISAARKYSLLDQDPVAAGRELRVDAVLEGSIQWDGKRRVRVTARLWRVDDNALLWADHCVEQCADIFALQDVISARVAAALATTLTSTEQKLLAKHHTENPEAYQLYLKGRYFWNQRTAEGFKKAIGYFQKAIDIDPNYALAYAGLADSYILKRVFGLLQPGETLPQMEAKARAAAEQALAMDDTLAEAHTSLGMIKMLTENDEADIEREYKRAIEINPNYATAHHWYALYLNEMGRFEEAIAEIRRALEIDPLSLVINSDVGIIFVVGRQYDRAIEHFKKAIEMDPNYPDAHAMLGWTYVLKGMYQEGIAEFEKARELFGSPTKALDGLIYAHSLSGNRSEALRVLGELKRLTKQQHTQIPWVHWVLIHIGLGEHDKAFEALEKAHREGVNVKGFLNIPQSDPLRSDPRFADLRRRVGLASEVVTPAAATASSPSSPAR